MKTKKLIKYIIKAVGVVACIGVIACIGLYMTLQYSLGNIQFDYNTEWIKGRTYSEIAESYGEFDYIYGTMYEDGTFYGEAGYVLREGWYTDYMILFDENGKAYEVRKSVDHGFERRERPKSITYK